MMKKILTYAVSALALASCSSDSLVSDSPANTQAPIAFNVGQKNITRSTNLEESHYNFGVWAYKYKTADATTGDVVMDHYLVGYSDGNGKGYDNSKVIESTWASNAGSETDHKSSWFYEGLGKDEYGYTGDKNYYKTSESANKNQYIRYWDLSYNNTKFFAYAPYKSTGVTFSNGVITVDKAANVAGYDNPEEHDFIYAGAQANNADKKDVKLTFKHLGAIVKVAFRESVPGYKVQLIDVKDATESGKGIQATPATSASATTAATYYTECGVTIDYSNNKIATPSVSVVTTDVTTSPDNLKFNVPTSGLVPYTGKDVNSTEYKVLPESDYATSSTTYYAVVQKRENVTPTTGFTFHVSYKLIAEDNGEVITVRDARVFVPATQVCWESNTSYTYNFTISQVSTGTTDPNEEIKLNNPQVPNDPTVCPIVFDGATIENYTPNAPNNGNIPY